MNVTRGGILYLQSQGLGTAITTISTPTESLEACFGLDVRHADVAVVGVNLMDIGDHLYVWIAHGTEGDGNWDVTQSHIWVAL